MLWRLAAQAGGGPWRVYALDPGGGYVAAVVAEGAGVALRLYDLLHRS